VPTRSQKVLAAVCDELLDADEATAGARRWTPLFIVASPRRQTGKTFLARLMADFLRLDGAPARVFDLPPDEDTLEPDERTIADYLPRLTMRASVADTSGQVALFDSLILDDGVGKVVDLGQPSFKRFFALAEEIGFMAEARRRAIEPIIAFPATPHPACIKAYADLARRFPRAVLLPVFNDTIIKGRGLRDKFPFQRTVAVPLQIPALPPALRDHATESGYSFVDFYGQLPMAIPLGHAFELRSWTKRVFLEFRELELRLLLEKLRTSLSSGL
jgi:hypothetical protein